MKHLFTKSSLKIPWQFVLRKRLAFASSIPGVQKITKSKREQRGDTVFLNVIAFYTFSHSLLVFFEGNFFGEAGADKTIWW